MDAAYRLEIWNLFGTKLCETQLLISFLDCSLLMYKNTVDFFCIFILYPTTLMNSFMISDSIFCGFLKIFCIQDYVI